MSRLFLILLMLFFAFNSLAGSLTAIKTELKDSNIHVLFNIKGDYTYKAFTLKNPERVVIDLTNVRQTKNYITSIKNQNIIKKIRYGKKSAKTLRVVLEVNKAVKLKILKNKNFGLDITLVAEKILINSENTIKKLRDIIIVIDPGHGGKDPGAIGPKKYKEKDIVLNIAKNLKKMIDKQPGMKAILTRNDDNYVGLRQRLAVARKYNADAFISIHADAFLDKHSNGASVFALSSRGATSEAARWLAAKENHSEIGGVNLSHLQDNDALLRTVLIDLSQTATISLSLEMGKRVLNSLNKLTTLHKSKVEQARFVVLKSPDIPSILIETGFISNPQEEKKLINKKYQLSITKEIFNGVRQYFFDYPPQGTLVENISGIVNHFAKRDEALLKNTTVAMLYHLNDLDVHDEILLN